MMNSLCYIAIESKCKKCATPYSSCYSSQTKCTSCLSGIFMQETTLVSSCSSGFTEINGKCELSLRHHSLKKQLTLMVNVNHSHKNVARAWWQRQHTHHVQLASFCMKTNAIRLVQMEQLKITTNEFDVAFHGIHVQWALITAKAVMLATSFKKTNYTVNATNWTLKVWSSWNALKNIVLTALSITFECIAWDEGFSIDNGKFFEKNG